jgi:hypothetical protein
MLEESELRALLGRDVVDREGKSVGNLETFFNDRNTGKPEWIGVFSGTFRQHHFLVPVKEAKVEGGVIQVARTKEQVHGAPEYKDPEGSISEEMEREAYRYYGLERAAV